MIKINLAPIEELENKLWYIPDLLVLAVVGLAGYSAMNLYFGKIKEEISHLEEETKDFETSYQRLKPDLERYAQLSQENEQLQRKVNSLKQITVSKIIRYKPIILLEHLQNLKPEGLWFNFLQDDSDEHIIRLVGGAFDSLLVAEFMATLLSTRFQELEATDLRTQVYFSKIHLERVAREGAKAPQKEANLEDKERQAFAAIQDQRLNESKGGEFWAASHKDFPEIAKFPGFEMNIKYEERQLNDLDLTFSSK